MCIAGRLAGFVAVAATVAADVAVAVGFVFAKVPGCGRF